MNTVKMMITIDQAAAIRAGKKEYGRAIIDIDPADLSMEQREILASCPYVSHEGQNIPLFPPLPKTIRDDFSGLPKVGEATPETAKILLDAFAAMRRREAEVEARLHEEKVARALTLPIDELIYQRGYDHYWALRDPIGFIADDPRLAEKIAEARQEIAARNTAMKVAAAEESRRREEEKAAREREEKQKRERQSAQIDAWVLSKGTDNQKKRAALNLLPRQEVLDAMRNEAFAALDDFPRYKKINNSEVFCRCGDCDDPEIKYEVEDKSEATAAEYDRMEQIQTLMPTARLRLRVHKGYCAACNATDDDTDNYFDRSGIMVEITVGDFTFTREYAV